MLSTARAVARLHPFFFFFFAAIAACTGDIVTGEDASSNGPSSSGSGAGGVGPGEHTVPPPPPSAAVPGDGAGSVTFAISKLYLGDTDRDGTPDHENGWKRYGFDLDGKISTASSIDLCKPRDDASPKNVYPDGSGGIDNSFGKNILPLFLGIASDFSALTNESILAGHGTEIFDLAALGAGSDYNPLVGRYYLGGERGGPPLFDGTDTWPIDPASVVSPGDPASAKVQFPGGYVAGDVWVGAALGGKLTVRLLLGGVTFDLEIISPIIAMVLDASHQHAKNGTIAGVLATEALFESFKTWAVQFEPGFCIGPPIDNIVTQFAQASDIMTDGSQDPSALCDGISIGLGFDAERIVLGPVGPAAPPDPNPCQ